MSHGPSREGPGAAELEAADREALLGVARSALESALLGVPGRVAPERLALRRSGGAFVSLHDRSGDLRGCVGQLSADRPLRETVARMAVAAATQDGRFARELKKISSDLRLSP